MLKKVVKIYLAGGMRSGWQDRVIQTLTKQFPDKALMFLDPRQNSNQDEAVYTAWDLEGVALADIVFVYVEQDNPSGFGACLEIGYARGLSTGKQIVSVIESEHPGYRYFGMAREASDFVTDSFSEGMDQLAAVIRKLTF